MQAAAFLEIERDLLAGVIRQQPEFTVFKGMTVQMPKAPDAPALAASERSSP